MSRFNFEVDQSGFPVKPVRSRLDICIQIAYCIAATIFYVRFSAFLINHALSVHDVMPSAFMQALVGIACIVIMIALFLSNKLLPYELRASSYERKVRKLVSDQRAQKERLLQNYVFPIVHSP